MDSIVSEAPTPHFAAHGDAEDGAQHQQYHEVRGKSGREFDR